MRVGINCLRIDPLYVGGVNSYTFGLLGGFSRIANGHQFQLYVTHANRHLFANYEQQRNFEVVVLDDAAYAIRKRLAQLMLLSQSDRVYKFTADTIYANLQSVIDEGSEVTYTPTTVLQSFNSRRPTVLSMHDIQHVHYPQFFSWSRKLSRRITYGLSARYAHFFQASSEYIKQDLLQHFDCIEADRIEVIPEGVLVEEFTAPSDIGALCAQHGIPGRFLLYPAQLWPHKNHMTLLRALKQIEKERGLKIPLVLTGGKFAAAPEILGYIAGQSMNYVRYLGKVSFAELVGLYQKAAFLVMPSVHESNSLPILEAAAAGTPIIASSIPPNVELGRVLQLNLFDPSDQQELADLIVALWNNESSGSAQAAHNRQHVGQYSWENTARKYMHLFERVADL